MAKVTIVEFSDFECPFSRRATPTIKRLLREFEGQVAWVFKNNPLEFHPRARDAAVAALAAHQQGRFVEMHARLFASADLSDDGIVAAAEAVGLDMQRFHEDRQRAAWADQVMAERDVANVLEAPGTPTFFINGAPMRGARSYGDFKRRVEEALRQADQALAAGNAPADLHAAMVRANHPNGELAVRLLVRGESVPAAEDPGRVTIDPTVHRVPVGPDDPAQGPPDALVTLVVFSDFECPFCARGYAVLQRLLSRFPGDLRLVFKHLPLPFHANARRAAEAAMAAHAQGRFWDYHDVLFAHRDALDEDSLNAYASEAGLDAAQFARDRGERRFAAHIDADLALAEAVGANGTPTLFINGRRAQGALPFEVLLPVVEEELHKARAMVDAGLSRHRVYEHVLMKAR